MSRALGPVGPPLVEGPLTVTDFVRYQGASGDMNPIHHDTAFAQAAGFPSVFAVGMRQAGVLAAYLGEHLGPDNVRRFDVQFRAIAWPGDTITYTGEIVAAEDTGAHTVCTVEVRATRQTGEIHLAGTAVFAIPKVTPQL
ncbi:MaoC family dehydratase [Dactylosporangium matsuzakiense]|uniref:MaoC-like dehydratase n=1 Tax=Dactylosporangium matsuzakiense TaxID=53360 RepID=A0A9W6KFE5_9ACTN|nr:MaoC/PaaZ C-terminal domain-containing protein [Dactylosporangium matsuzakiense]UWZ47102.1 dehydratase [Dactylosporangium matsuzakiense]GLK98463.1 MaoC-like dehydratase [Dactylosporangium matsuzakiense]